MYTCTQITHSVINMKLVKAKLLRAQIQKGSYNGTEYTNYVFVCQETDLDHSLIPVTIKTSDLDASRILEKMLSDGDFHLIPIQDIRVNQRDGHNTFNLDVRTVMHPDFLNVDLA